MIVVGQVRGGVAQGCGQAVTERTHYDPSSGQLLSGNFTDYALPRADDLPEIEVELIEVPCTKPAGREGRRGGRSREPAGPDQRHYRCTCPRRPKRFGGCSRLPDAGVFQPGARSSWH
jgi:hypothetical protein